VIVYRRKTRLKIEEEFVIDIRTRLRMQDVKKRCFDNVERKTNDRPMELKD
jgi:hypothetical protein